ncbi:hypothetical protein [Aestuariibacter salexigens]|uniref:hypothetical protein n=1 Tax=Aestuariibacter salexigens TaxID=226010 RepID=UPI00041AE957|nr:hypothetical protein [Aestuariibacter salexigens]
MINTSTQVSAVEHTYMRQEHREASLTMSDRASPPSSSDAPSLTDELVENRLTAEQQAKKFLIESLSSDDFATALKNLVEYIEVKQASSSAETEQNASRGPSAQIRVRERLQETEQLHYATTLSMIDEDLKHEQTLSMSVQFSRQLDIEREVTMSIRELQDPLLFNLGNKTNLIGNSSHDFDLDGDGQTEAIPTLAKDIWYLAYDQNGNGEIDNGMELFGAKSGDGFAELRQLDSDDSGWIDETDERFASLSLWDGRNQQRSLQEAGIKGISLFSSATPFTFTDNVGQTVAQLRQTSVYLSDDNSLGAVHQVDFAV